MKYISLNAFVLSATDNSRVVYDSRRIWVVLVTPQPTAAPDSRERSPLQRYVLARSLVHSWN